MSEERLDRMPAQHRVGDVCAVEGCSTSLSRYNPYTICGACRIRLALEIEPEDEMVDRAGDVARRRPLPWDRRSGRRVPVRRGPLLDETAA